MNYKRILVGGLLAGIILNASEFLLNGVVQRAEMQVQTAEHALVFASWAMIAYVLMAFLWGFALAWVYAALRPRFGPGLGTGLIAAAVVWTLTCLTPSVSLAAVGLVGSGSFAIGLVWAAVEMAVAGIVAGAVYHEGATSPATQAVPAI